MRAAGGKGKSAQRPSYAAAAGADENSAGGGASPRPAAARETTTMAGAERVALIAGGVEDAAESVARELIRRDWAVALHGPAGEALDRAVERLDADAEWTDQVAACPGELTVAADREQLVERVLDEFDRVDLLVCTPAGPAAGQDLLEMVQESYEHVQAACVTAPLFLAQRVANEMVRLVEAGAIEAAKIVFVNSIGAYTSFAGRPAHCLAAAATAMLARLFADALGEHGINVYEVRAGLISYRGADEVHARYGRLIEEGLTPIRRWGRPQDIALAVAAVADDLLPFSTGEVINVDGGFHLRRL